MLEEHAGEAYYWRVLVTCVPGALWWSVLVEHNSGTYWWSVLVEHVNGVYWWSVLVTLVILYSELRLLNNLTHV